MFLTSSSGNRERSFIGDQLCSLEVVPSAFETPLPLYHKKWPMFADKKFLSLLSARRGLGAQNPLFRFEVSLPLSVQPDSALMNIMTQKTGFPMNLSVFLSKRKRHIHNSFQDITLQRHQVAMR